MIGVTSQNWNLKNVDLIPALRNRLEGDASVYNVC
jgi:hypothetical protein